jgi:hypothetical protein
MLQRTHHRPLSCVIVLTRQHIIRTTIVCFGILLLTQQLAGHKENKFYCKNWRNASWNWQTYQMEHYISSCKTVTFLIFCVLEIPLILWNTKVHYRVHWIQMNPEIKVILSWDVTPCDSAQSICANGSVAPVPSTFRIKSFAVKSQPLPHNLFI